MFFGLQSLGALVAIGVTPAATGPECGSCRSIVMGPLAWKLPTVRVLLPRRSGSVRTCSVCYASGSMCLVMI